MEGIEKTRPSESYFDCFRIGHHAKALLERAA